jgi:hypothetical protein
LRIEYPRELLSFETFSATSAHRPFFGWWMIGSP